MIVSTVFAQSGSGFNYQAIARDGSGEPLSETSLSLELSILQGSENGDVLWSEQHSVNTSVHGHFAVIVGGGERSGGSAAIFEDVDWSEGPFYLKTTLDAGSGPVDLGSTMLSAVPLALASDVAHMAYETTEANHALTADRASEADHALTADKATEADMALESGHASTADVAETALSLDQPMGNIKIVGDDETQDTVLFEVKRSDGTPVFAVFEHGVNVYVDESETKGIRGGFAVGGYTKKKGDEQGSNMLYIDNTSTDYPLIYGDFQEDFVDINGNLYVWGNLLANDFIPNTKGAEVSGLEGSLDKLPQVEALSDGTKIGVAAAQVEAVAPALVEKAANGRKAINYSGMVTMLLEAMQEQQEQIEALEQRLMELESK